MRACRRQFEWTCDLPSCDGRSDRLAAMAEHRMLVVEDHQGIRFAFRGIFSRMGWKVHLAKTVAEGLALLDDGPEPCCLILDLDMPDGRPEGVMEKVRAKNMKTRVVVCTGSMDTERLTAIADLKP